MLESLDAMRSRKRRHLGKCLKRVFRRKWRKLTLSSYGVVLCKQYKSFTSNAVEFQLTLYIAPKNVYGTRSKNIENVML